MKKIDYQAPVIKTLTMDILMQSASQTGTGGYVDGNKDMGYDGVDDGSHDPEAKGFGSRSVWDD